MLFIYIFLILGGYFFRHGNYKKNDSALHPFSSRSNFVGHILIRALYLVVSNNEYNADLTCQKTQHFSAETTIFRSP